MWMMLAFGGVTAFFITVSYILAVPSFGAVISGKDANPIVRVTDTGLGHAGSKVALTMVVIAFVSCTLAIQAAAIRLIFSYARDGMIMGSRPLSTVSGRFHMPPGAVLIAAVIPALITLMPTATVARIITFAVVGSTSRFSSSCWACCSHAGVVGRRRVRSAWAHAACGSTLRD
jgi:amino acid transporter